MDGANTRFKTQKEDWLQDHLIVYDVLVSGSDNPFKQDLSTVNAELPVFEFDLRKIGGIMTNNGQGKEYALVQMDQWVGRGRDQKAREKTGGTNAIEAYFLPWGVGRTFCGKLGTNADYFFTPTLNGCTFAYSDNGASPSVAHANFVDPLTTLADQNALDADLQLKFGGLMPANRLIKTDYKRPPVGQEDYRATVIGIRRGNGWRFFNQNYKVELGGADQPTVRTGRDMCHEI